MITPLFGAHVSISGGYEMALEKLAKMGGNTLQIFSSSPRSWQTASVDEATARSFKKKASDLHIGPVYFHATYLINLADAGTIGAQSKRALIAEMNAASAMGIKGSIIHLGSYKQEETKEKFETLTGNIEEILEQTPEDTLFIIENAGNKKIGKNLQEIKQIMEAAGSSRVRVCLDSCHLFSAGYSLQTQDKADAFVDEFDRLIGLKNLEVWHLNDSRDPLDSGRDRHENIGQGTIGRQEFAMIINHPRLTHLPFIIETPGFDQKGPDKANLDILKELVWK